MKEVCSLESFVSLRVLLFSISGGKAGGPEANRKLSIPLSLPDSGPARTRWRGLFKLSCRSVCAAEENPCSARMTLMDLSAWICVSACPYSTGSVSVRRADHVTSFSILHLLLKRCLSSSSSCSASITCHQRLLLPFRGGCHIDVTVAVTMPMKPRLHGNGEIECRNPPPQSHLSTHALKAKRQDRKHGKDLSEAEHPWFR